MVSSFLSRPSVARSVRPSFVGCPAPAAVEVLLLAQRFPGLGVVSVRASGRSFSGWVAVCSFRERAVAFAFSRAAAAQLLGAGCFCVVRSAGRRFRVSVPCLSPYLFAVRLRRVVRLGRFRVAPVFGPSAPGAAALPAAVSAALSSATVVGFSGSRRLAGVVSSAALLAAVAAVPSSASVLVGCATGVDAVVRLACPSARVFSVASGAFGSGRGAFAARSTACVRAVAAAGSAGLWVSFPSGACPAGLLPSTSSSRCFSGSGSGTWASLALAVGLGVPSLVFLPAGVLPPAGWGLRPVAGWFSFSPASVQLSLL